MAPYPLCFSLLGDTATSLPWGAALPAILPCATTRSLPPSATDGVLVVGALDGEALAGAKDAVVGGTPLLCLAPVQLDHGQVSELCQAAGRGGALLRYADPIAPGAGVAFLTRLLAGGEPMLQPSYVRVLRLATAEGSAGLAELLKEELAWATSLFGAAQRVVALPGRRDLARAPVVFVTLEYAAGITVQCTVSHAEGTDSRQVVIATGERALVLDKSGTASGLQSDQAREEERTAASDELVRFCQAIRSGDASPGNGLLWEDVARVWAAGLESAHSGMPAAIEVRRRAEAETAPPPLRLMKGGGKSGGRGARPCLTLVAS